MVQKGRINKSSKLGVNLALNCLVPENIKSDSSYKDGFSMLTEKHHLNVTTPDDTPIRELEGSRSRIFIQLFIIISYSIVLLPN